MQVKLSWEEMADEEEEEENVSQHMISNVRIHVHVCTRNAHVHILPRAGQPTRVGTSVESLHPALRHTLSSSHTPSPQTQPNTLR